MPYDTEYLIQLDKAHVWHPFTQMRDWIAPDHEPLVLVAGHGPWVEDSLGKRYLDGNSSIWTNIHGHNHPTLNRAIGEQLGHVAHTSILGFTNPKAAELAKRLVAMLPGSSLTRGFIQTTAPPQSRLRSRWPSNISSRTGIHKSLDLFRLKMPTMETLSAPPVSVELGSFMIALSRINFLSLEFDRLRVLQRSMLHE